MQFNARTPAGLTAYLVIASTAAFGSVVAINAADASATGHKPAVAERIPAATPAKAVIPATRPATRLAAKPAKPAQPAKHAQPAKPAQPAKKTYANDLNGWVAQARDLLAQHGDAVPSAGAIEARALTESSGNPRAENHWDGNQALYGGTYGLIQTIRPTFEEWSLPGHKDILNPVDSIIAGVRYANDRYGSFDNIAYGKQGY
ncbi:hypothetical protein ABIA33_000151 [Streptacidiphilus sp. MAP12-16]|uniref:transglycosylase SLT domain-containing protein n=1 Tax=Streptacidiphilus sp. MAP12-16 TaxID=3156300 RepID=UPI00351767D8